MFSNLKNINFKNFQKEEFLKFFFLVLLFLIPSFEAISQTDNVGIGQSTAPTFPNNSALLDLDVSNMATKRGLLVPRMTNAEMTGITTPATGLIVYNTTDNNFYYYTGSQWIALVSAIATVGFDRIATGSNTSATMTVGNGSSILTSGSGSVQANKFITSTSLTDNVDLATSEVSGILPIANGGTATSSIAANGQLLIGNGTGYALANLIQGTGITISNGAGTITISTNASQIDHGSLTGLADDDHSQYALLAGRAGGQTLYGGTAASNNLTLSSTSNGIKGNYILSDFTSAGFVKTNASGVLSVSGAINLASSDVTGTLPIANGGTATTSIPANGQLLIGNGTGYAVANLSEGTGITITNGAGTITISTNASEIDHGNLTGLADDDHSQYALLAGRAGGQTLYGGTAASNNLTLSSTSNGTKGNYILSDFTSTGFVKTNASGVLSVSGAVNLASSDVTGTLPIANGGTATASVPANGQLLIGNGTGYAVANLTEGTGITITNGAGTISIATDPSSFDHGSLQGLADDDHSQYALLAGRAGGQTLYGGTAASNNLTLSSTSNGIKGNYILSDFTSAGFVKTNVSGVLSVSGAVNLASSDVTGTLPITNGGTNASTYTQGEFLWYNGTSLVASGYDENSFEQALTKGNLTETGSSILTITGGTGAVIGAGTTIQVAQASGTTSGFLSSTDWTTFNNKQNSLSLGNLSTSTTGVTITGGTGAVVGSGATVNIATASSSLTGLLTSTDWTTFNNKVSGSGASDRVAYWNGTGSITYSDNFLFNGTNIGLGIIINPSYRLNVSGDVQISGTTVTGTGLTVSSGNVLMANTGTASELIFREPSGSGTNYSSIKAQAQTSDISYTLPSQLPATNGFLRSDNTGNLDWQSVSSVPTGTTEGQTLRWDNTNSEWDVSSILINDGTNVGINITSPAVLLHQDNGNATSTYHKFTAGTTTGQTSTDGFSIGIDNSGNAQLYQYENLDMMFYTNNTERVRILNGGNVGIGTNNPVNKLDIEGAIAIGSSYSGTLAAPTDGLIVEGKVGIGTNAVSPDSIYFKVVGDAMVDGDLVVTGTIDPQAIFMVPISTTPSEPVAGMFYYDDNDDNFKFYTDEWVTPVWSSAESLPSGTDGATLRHDGSAWVSATNLYNDGTGVGINTSSLTDARFKVVDATATDGYSAVRIENSSATTGTSYALYATKTGAGTTNVGGYFSASGGTNNYGLIIANGYAGFGTTSPEVTVDIDGGLALRAGTEITANSTSYNVTVGSRSYLKINSDNTPANRIIILSDGLREGQVLIIQSTATGGFNGIRFEEASSNVRLTQSGIDLIGPGTIISFIWDGSDWIETGYCDNR